MEDVKDDQLSQNALAIEAFGLEPGSDQDAISQYRIYVADGLQGLKVYQSKPNIEFFHFGVYETPGTAPFVLIFNNSLIYLNKGVKWISDALGKVGLSPLSNIVDLVREKAEGKTKDALEYIGYSWPEIGISEKANWTIILSKLE